MMRSLSSAVAGLRTHQTKMDVIGNNIANVNTYGFKSSRVTFADVYYQNLGAASSPVDGQRGGTNPTQIGYGSMLSSIDILNTQSGAASTDRAMDVYITGDGFLVTRDSAGQFLYTRLGNLYFDPDGNLVDVNGNYVLGCMASPTGEPVGVNDDGTVNSGNLSSINVDKDLFERMTGISISSSGEIVGILPSGEEIKVGTLDSLTWLNAGSIRYDESYNYTGDVKITTGYQIDITTSPAPDWLESITCLDAMGASNAAASIQVVAGEIILTIGTDTYRGQYAENGKVKLIADPTNHNPNVEGFEVVCGGVPVATANTATPGGLDMKFGVTMNTQTKSGRKVEEFFELTNLTQTSQVVVLGGITMTIDVSDLTPAGVESTNVINQTIGRIEAGEGDPVVLGFIILAKFPNAAGLSQAGNSNFIETGNSGEPVFVRPGLEGSGDLTANYLEMSNVDISKEFTDMITTQRGFQANTRIITVSDEMLQELVNLKR